MRAALLLPTITIAAMPSVSGDIASSPYPPVTSTPLVDPFVATDRPGNAFSAAFLSRGMIERGSVDTTGGLVKPSRY